MTRKELQSFILARLDELERWYADDPPDPDKIVAKERRVVYEVADRMARAGFHRLHSAGLALDLAENKEAVKTYLSRCLRALRPKRRAGSSTAGTGLTMLTPPQVARRYGVSPDTVRNWIERGDLRAVNVSAAKRPRYRVPVEALTELDAKRLPTVVPASRAQCRRRPKPAGLLVTRFSSGR